MVDNKENYKFDLGVKGLMYLSSSIQIVTWHLQLKMTRVIVTLSLLLLLYYHHNSHYCYHQVYLVFKLFSMSV